MSKVPRDGATAFAARCAWRVLPFALIHDDAEWIQRHFQDVFAALAVATLRASGKISKKQLKKQLSDIEPSTIYLKASNSALSAAMAATPAASYSYAAYAACDAATYGSETIYEAAFDAANASYVADTNWKGANCVHFLQPKTLICNSLNLKVLQKN